MFLHFQRCLGLRVFRFKRRQLEIWFCPRGEIIPAHVHKEMDSRITFIAGRMSFKGEVREVPLSWRTPFFTLTAKAGEVHSAKITGAFGIFANYEKWFSCPTSAAHDFTRTERTDSAL